MGLMDRVTYHWTNIFGKPEKVSRHYFIDDYGGWDSYFCRASGTPLHVTIDQLDLHNTKRDCIAARYYKETIFKAIQKVKY